MTTKLITIGLVVIACWVGWLIYGQWTSVSDEQKLTLAEAEARKVAVSFSPRSLAGMPEKTKDALENALDKAQQNGAVGLRDWLKAYKKFVEDPRLAWIQLDYCVLVAHENPAEAKKVFAEVKERIGPTSPVYPRIKQLEKTYE
jgi:predicted methyltransferase